MHNEFGFVRVSSCSPKVHVGNPMKNANEIIGVINKLNDSDIIVFPELCITGYTCGDLFRQRQLHQEVEKAIQYICNEVKTNQLIFVGAPIVVNNEMFNCAIVINNKEIVGIVPKTNIPNYAEFYESRWFRSANGDEPKTIRFDHRTIPFGTDLFFKYFDLTVFAEICEDLWMPIPPSSQAVINGANVIVNLSASNETVGKNEYRRDLVKNQSGRCVAGYIYSSAGPSESTADVVFGGHCLIAENGKLLKESVYVGDSTKSVPLNGWNITADLDIQLLQSERTLLSSFGDSRKIFSKDYRKIDIRLIYNREAPTTLLRHVDGTPFVPKDPIALAKRCAEVFGIQQLGLHKRLEQIKFGKVYIGVSGGLDSTLALLVAVKAYQRAGVDVKNIHGITMPGFGTTGKTKTNAIDLMTHLGISQETIDIREICLATFKAIKHKPFGIDVSDMTLSDFELALTKVPKENRKDLVFENVQARERTKILMSLGFVLGTGNMSEGALGWCTYNGDHMSMYNVNGGVPKTLVKFLVRYVSLYQCEENLLLKETLEKIWETVISPELLPLDENGEIEQSTEDTLGPYELHDFFMANSIRPGFSPKKILFLTKFASFENRYEEDFIKKILKTFFVKFFIAQFKRDCVPNAPKVGSTSLSPRGDWRMPSDADPTIWIEENL
jgi:NAD+ synthase (glutamine-hydrolysing)